MHFFLRDSIHKCKLPLELPDFLNIMHPNVEGMRTHYVMAGIHRDESVTKHTILETERVNLCFLVFIAPIYLNA